MRINEKLNHLSENDLKNLIERYYKDEKVSDLIKEFNIDCRPSELIKLFPLEELKDTLCDYCNVPMVRKLQSRNEYSRGVIYCPLCLHRFEDRNCNCDNCNNQKRKLLLSKQKVSKKIHINELSLRDRVYITTLLRGVEWNECNDKLIIYPLNSTDKKLAPIWDRELEILKYLFKRGIISIDFNSDLEAFTGNLLECTYGDEYYVNKVRYILNIEYSNELLNPNIDLKNEDSDEVYDIAREIILEECYEYLINQMNKVKFSFSPGKKTEDVFNELLDKFSLGQVFSIIYNSITNATRYYQEGNVSKKQASNSVITRCEGYGERAIANGWDIKPFTRPRDCEQSIISRLYFNRILSVGDKSFTTILSIDIFKEIFEGEKN